MTHEHTHAEIDDEQAIRFDTLEMAAELAAAYVSNNPVHVAHLPGLIADVHQALLDRITPAPATPKPEPLKPAVPISKSVQQDHIVCLEDGKHFKSLKRHLHSEHGLSPDEFRAKWGLGKDFPMVAPAYAEQRSALAKSTGLGTPRPAAKPARAPGRPQPAHVGA